MEKSPSQTYEVTGTLLGVSDTFNVTTNAVVDIDVDDVWCFEGNGDMQGHWDEQTDSYIENSWMEYSYDVSDYTITFNDGKINNRDYAVLLQYLNKWDVTLGAKS